MAKCRMLLQENEELGKTVSSGRIAKLEGDIALKNKLILEMKKSEQGSSFVYITKPRERFGILAQHNFNLQSGINSREISS